jgi:hypothetical protein
LSHLLLLELILVRLLMLHMLVVELLLLELVVLHELVLLMREESSCRVGSREISDLRLTKCGIGRRRQLVSGHGR